MKLKQGLLLLLTMVLVLFSAQVVRADTIEMYQVTQAGATALYSVNLQNEGDAAHQYTLMLTGLPDSMTVTFTQGGPVVDQVEAAAQSSSQVFIRIETTRATPVGVYNGQFVATRDDGEVLQMPLTLAVENTYAVQIVSQTMNASVFSGQEFSFDVTASNSGAASLSNVHLQVDAPAKWIVKTDPTEIPELAIGQNVDFHASVITPPSQIAIDQPLQITVAGDQVSSEASTLMVRVQKSPSYLFAATALMLVAVIGVFVYFRRKGRR